MAKYSTEEIDQAYQDLRLHLKPGDRIYTILRKYRTGSNVRYISLITFTKEGDVLNWDRDVAKILGSRVNEDGEGVYTNGGGMDMGFWLVNQLSMRLFHNGLSLKHIWL